MKTASFDDARRPTARDLQTFLDPLARTTGKQPRRSGREWKSLCPAHDDHSESLDVRAGDRQLVVAICRSHNCQWDDVLAACGFDAPRPGYRPPAWTAPAAKKAEKRRELGPVVAEYHYSDEQSQTLFTVVRHDPKDFRQRRPDPDRPGRWRWNLDGVRRGPYRLPHLRTATAAGRRVYLVEGEKDAETIAALGLEATAHAQGAKNWRSDYAEYLAGAHVVVIPDNDSEGRAWADAAVADLLLVAASV